MRNDELYRIVRDTTAERYREMHSETTKVFEENNYAGSDLAKFMIKEMHSRTLAGTNENEEGLHVTASLFAASLLRGLGALPLLEQVRVFVYGVVGELTDFDDAMTLPEDWQTTWPEQVYSYIVARDIAKRSTIESIPQWIRSGMILSHGYVPNEGDD